MPRNIPYEQITSHFANDEASLNLLSDFTESIAPSANRIVEDVGRDYDLSRLHQAASDYLALVRRLKEQLASGQSEAAIRTIRECNDASALFERRLDLYTRDHEGTLPQEGNAFTEFWDKTGFEAGKPGMEALMDQYDYKPADPTVVMDKAIASNEEIVRQPARMDPEDDFEYSVDYGEEGLPGDEKEDGEEKREEEKQEEEKQNAPEEQVQEGGVNENGQKEDVKDPQAGAGQDGQQPQQEQPQQGGIPEDIDEPEEGAVPQDLFVQADPQNLPDSYYKPYLISQWQQASEALTPEDRKKHLSNIVYAQALIDRAARKGTAVKRLNPRELEEAAGKYAERHADAYKKLFADGRDQVFTDLKNTALISRVFRAEKTKAIQTRYQQHRPDHYKDMMAELREDLKETGHGVYFGVFARFWNSGSYKKVYRTIKELALGDGDPTPREQDKAVKTVLRYLDGKEKKRTGSFGRERWFSCMTFLKYHMKPADFRQYCQKVNLKRGITDPRDPDYVHYEDFGSTRPISLRTYTSALHSSIMASDEPVRRHLAKGIAIYNASDNGYYHEEMSNLQKELRISTETIDADPDFQKVYETTLASIGPEEMKKLMSSQTKIEGFANYKELAAQIREVEAGEKKPVIEVGVMDNGGISLSVTDDVRQAENEMEQGGIGPLGA